MRQKHTCGLIFSTTTVKEAHSHVKTKMKSLFFKSSIEYIINPLICTAVLYLFTFCTSDSLCCVQLHISNTRWEEAYCKVTSLLWGENWWRHTHAWFSNTKVQEKLWSAKSEQIRPRYVGFRKLRWKHMELLSHGFYVVFLKHNNIKEIGSV